MMNVEKSMLSEFMREAHSNIYYNTLAKDYREEWERTKLIPTKPIENYNTKNFKRFRNRFNYLYNDGKDIKEQRIKIVPLGLNNFCHYNSKLAVEIFGDDFERVIGYNINFCDCGKHINCEIHSVVRDKRNGALYDLTKDFDNMKEKLFIEILDKEKAEDIQLSKNVDFINNGVYSHYCKRSWFELVNVVGVDLFSVDE